MAKRSGAPVVPDAQFAWNRRHKLELEDACYGERQAVSPSPTQHFIKEAATSDMLEVESEKLADLKGNTNEKTFAKQMITDHNKQALSRKGWSPAK